MKVISYQGKIPQIHDDAWIGEGVCLIGDVKISAGANIWYNCVLRADMARIEIGEDTNIQDGCVCHVDTNQDLIVGNRVTVGHNAVLHACTIEDEVLIGMSATILSGAVIKSGAVVGAGAVVPENMIVEENMLVAGVPAKPKKKLDLKEKILQSSKTYLILSKNQEN